MELFINKLLSGIIQVAVFSAIPFIFWIFFYRNKETFFKWIGVKSIEISKIKEVVKYSMLVLLFYFPLSYFILKILEDVEVASSEFTGLGIVALPSVLVYAFITTGLSEEILFRGFLLKRFSNKFDLKLGNIIQASLFALIHGIMFFTLTNVTNTIIIIIFTAVIGWIMGYINEEKADGSIVPSWILHGISNVFACLLTLFV